MIQVTRRKTHEEFVREIQEKYGNEYSVLGKYVSAHIKILIRHNCNKCNNYEWEVSPNSLLHGHGCPKCKGSMKKTTEMFKQEVKEKFRDEYSILEKYVNDKTKIKVRHNSEKCNNYEWLISPSNLLHGCGCPVCANRRTVLGINTIYDTDKWMVDLGILEEDAKKYSHSSNKKITVTCPDCGRKRNLKIEHIYTYKSILCPCGDGKSYPEKFMMNTLEQLKLNYEIEYSAKWCKGKRYDFYIPSLNTIIETHGEQHYNNRKSFNSLNRKTLEEEQQNDNYKEKLALKNGIKHYITIDCRNSELEWIKNNILNSELNKLFDLSKIDWNECAKFANKNIVKEVCDYWNNKRENEGTIDLEKIFKLNRGTIIRYLKRGNELGWCSYDTKKEVKRYSSKNGKLNGKKLKIFKNNKSLGLFESCAELSQKSEKLFGVKLLASNISKACRGEISQYKGFTFKYIY